MKSRITLLPGILSMGLLSVSCGKTLPAATDLGELRVLTLIADQPEANPSTTITLTPVVSDINGAGRTLNYSVQTCIDPGIAYGKAPTCPAPDAVNTQSGTVTPAAGTSSTYTGAVSTFTITLPAQDVIFAGHGKVDQYNGVAYLVFYTLSVSGVPISNATSVTTLKRIMVSTTSKTTKNQNPVITSINNNDTAITGVFTMPTQAVNFSSVSPASSAETYSTLQKDGSLTQATETLLTSWFISDGTIQYTRTSPGDEDKWTPPDTKPTSRGLVIIAVTRDERGGEAFQKIEMN